MLKEEIKYYKEWNKDGWFSPKYAELMYNTESDEIWADCFYSLGRNEWNEYHSKAVVNLGQLMREDGYSLKDITVKSVTNYIKNNFKQNIEK